MTDNEIIKALEICLNETDICNGCPYEFDDCLNEDGTSRLMQDALDLINRQKAEIERLKWGEYRHIGKTITNARNEAIEDFAERLKEKYKKDFNSSWRSVYNPIDNLVKEMVGDIK